MRLYHIYVYMNDNKGMVRYVSLVIFILYYVTLLGKLINVFETTLQREILHWDRCTQEREKRKLSSP